MEFLLAIVVFGGMLAVCLIGFTTASRSAAKLNPVGSFGPSYADRKTYQPERAPARSDARAHDAPAHDALAQVAQTQEHPILQATEAKPRPVKNQPGKLM